MGLLENFEKGLERTVNGLFARTFRSGVQPLEISAALKRELDRKAAIVSRDRALVPNNFDVQLSVADYERMERLGSSLHDELRATIEKYAQDQGFQFAGPVSLVITSSSAIAEGVVSVESSSAAGKVAWSPTLEINGVRHTLRAARTIVGRDKEADITIDDANSSRKHLEILWDGRNARVRDLGSTNGTLLNGGPVTTAVLEPESVIRVGKTEMIFRVIAIAAERTAQSSASPKASARRTSEGFWGPA